MKRKSNVDKENVSKKMCQTTLGGPTDSTIKGEWRVGESLMVFTPDAVAHQSKILALDMDSTIILTASGKVFPVDMNDWRFMTPKVAPILKSYHDDGFKIVIMSNQSSLKDESKIPSMKQKIQNIIDKLNIPIQAFISIRNDVNRKPRTGLWRALEMENNSIEIVIKDSIYCGDAAGRIAVGKIKKDHSHADRLFALNVGVPFKTPEELWDNEPCSRDLYELSFDPKKLLDNPPSQPTPLSKRSSPELLMMVGLPASGKSFFCQDQLIKLDYHSVNRDTLGTIPKCISKAKEYLAQGKSVIVDNTNLDLNSRKPFLDLAKTLSIPVRALVMETTPANSLHNEMFRQLTGSSHEKINTMVFNMMKKKYVEPSVSEGFVEVLKIPFVPLPPAHLRDLYFQYLLEK